MRKKEYVYKIHYMFSPSEMHSDMALSTWEEVEQRVTCNKNTQYVIRSNPSDKKNLDQISIIGKTCSDIYEIW